jgi:hypothetical protein
MSYPSIATDTGEIARSLFQLRTWKAYGGKNPKRNPSCGTRRWYRSEDSNTLHYSLMTTPIPDSPNAN